MLITAMGLEKFKFALFNERNFTSSLSDFVFQNKPGIKKFTTLLITSTVSLNLLHRTHFVL